MKMRCGDLLVFVCRVSAGAGAWLRNGSASATPPACLHLLNRRGRSSASTIP